MKFKIFDKKYREQIKSFNIHKQKSSSLEIVTLYGKKICQKCYLSSNEEEHFFLPFSVFDRSK